ncbi:MAG: nicotinate mononucleotide-dependent phosphoribosyltransferase CobT [Thermosynechococcaceae cyanobacterium]
MIRVYTQQQQGQEWLQRHRNCAPLFACILGFTETALHPGISAAGNTPRARRFTAIADAEFLINGPSYVVQYPLPPLDQGASPVFISRAVLNGLGIPQRIFNAGLPTPPPIDHVDLGGQPARCLSSGRALPLAMVKQLWRQGLQWGQKLAIPGSYLICSECVVGGTTTALAILTGLGFSALGKVNSSHPICNHAQKQQIVETGLRAASDQDLTNPLMLAAAVGDPMQIVVAGMMIAASRSGGVLLAGGTQMLAVYALARAIAQSELEEWCPEQVVIGTTRWVAEDPTGDTVGLADLINAAPLLASQLDFSASSYPQLRAYEQGFVKEGVGAGGCAIAASLYQGWHPDELLNAVETLLEQYSNKTQN